MKKILDICEKYAPELMILLLCVPAYIGLKGIIDSYHVFFYFTDYSTGFGGKKLIGELCSFWLPEVVQKRHIFPLILAVNTLMIGLFAWFCGRCIRSQSTNQFAWVIFITVYLLSPYSFIGLVSNGNFDFYLCAATLLFLYLYLKHKGTWYYYALSAIILSTACLIHQIFCNIYFPLVFAIFVYDVFADETNRKKNIIMYASITLVLFCLFCAIALFSTMNVDLNTYYDYLQTRTTESIDLSYKPALYYEYYARLPEHISAYVEPIWKYNIARFVFTLIVFLPFWAILWTPWIMAIKSSDSMKEKWCLLLMQISMHVIILPAYIMAVDYQRWTYAYCFCQVCILLIMYMQNNQMKRQIDTVIAYLIEHKTFSLLGVLYICSFGLVDNASSAPIVEYLCGLFDLQWKVNEVLPMN